MAAEQARNDRMRKTKKLAVLTPFGNIVAQMAFASTGEIDGSSLTMGMWIDKLKAQKAGSEVVINHLLLIPVSLYIQTSFLEHTHNSFS